MDELWRLSALRGGEGSLASHVVEVEIPVVQEILSYPPTQAITVIGFEFQFSIAPDVVQVFAHGLEVVAGTRQYLHHRFRRPPDSPPDLLHLRRRHSAARLARPTAAIARDVQQGLPFSNPKRLLRHAPSSSWSHSP